MKISEDHSFFQEIVADRKIAAAISHGGKDIDLEPIWDWCTGIEFEDGGWIFQQLEGGYYEVHTLFKPKALNVLEKARKALFYMFTATDALEIVTRVPADLPHALRLAKDGGFKHRFRQEKGWDRPGEVIPCDFLGLTIDEWTRGNKELMAIGDDFHAKLGEHKSHGDDGIHDAYAGLGVACWSGNQAVKGLWRYNRWAVSCGYRPMRMDQDGAIRFDGLALRMVNSQIIVEDESCR